MPLLRSRPRVTVRLPRAVAPGTSFVAEVSLDAPAPVPIDFVDVRLDGTELSLVGEGKHPIRSERSLVALAARLSGPRTLPLDTTKFACHFELPARLPASYTGMRATVEYVLSLHVSIPWWPDRRAQYYVVVVTPPAALPDAGGVRFSSRPEGPLAQEAHVECSLSTTTLAPGSILSGSVALSNVRFNRYRGIKVALVGMETVQTPDRKQHRKNETIRYGIELPVDDAVQEAAAHPFQMRIPSDLQYTRKSDLFELAWYIEVSAKLSWARDVVVDIPVVVPPGLAANPDLRKAAPSVGSDRIDAVWAAVAGSFGWQLADQAMVGKAGEADVTVRRDHRGRQGIFLAADLRIPSLHLGLGGGPNRGIAVLWTSGVELGVPAWDRRNRIRGREAGQVRALLAPLVPALQRLELDRVDDTCFRVIRREAGLTPAPLTAFLRDVVALGEALVAARAAIPVPRAMASAKEAWTELATRLETRLEQGDMGIAGTLGPFMVEVFTAWGEDAEPLHTVVQAHATEPVRDDHRLEWRAGEFTSGDRSRIPEASRALLDEVLDGATSVSLDGDGVEVWLPAPMLDPSPCLSRLRTLCDLLASLRAGAGPYR